MYQVPGLVISSFFVGEPSTRLAAVRFIVYFLQCPTILARSVALGVNTCLHPRQIPVYSLFLWFYFLLGFALLLFPWRGKGALITGWVVRKVMRAFCFTLLLFYTTFVLHPWYWSQEVSDTYPPFLDLVLYLGVKKLSTLTILVVHHPQLCWVTRSKPVGLFWLAFCGRLQTFQTLFGRFWPAECARQVFNL